MTVSWDNPEVQYLRWFKTRPRVRYELTCSGIPPATLADFATPLSPAKLEVNGAYGDPELIGAIAERSRVPEKNVVPVTGASTGIFIALATAIQRGDAILVEHPVYDPIQRVAAFLGLKVTPILRSPDSSFAPSPNEIASALDRGVRAVVLTNLHNPSGQYLSREAVLDIANTCADSGATLIIDEVYLDAAHLTSDQPIWTAAGLADNVIAINSLTKVYGLGGLRVGWLIADPARAERARTTMDLLAVDNPAPSASLAIEAFARIGRLEDRYRRFHQEGQLVFRRWLAAESLVRGYPNQGAIFEYLRLPEGVTSGRLNDLLVKEYETQVVPGYFFGQDDHVRMSVALPPADLQEALSRISCALRRLLEEAR